MLQCLPLTFAHSLSGILLAAALMPATVQAQQSAPDVSMLRKAKVWVGLESFAFGPAGKYVAAGMGTFTFNGRLCGGDVVVWTIKSRKIKKQMSGHTAPITSLAFTPDGKQIVSVSDSDGEVRVFNLKRGKEERSFKMPVLDSEWTSLAPVLSADGRTVAHFGQETLDIAGDEKHITGDLQVFDVATGKVRWQRKRTYAETRALSPDGSLLAYYAQELNFKVVDGEADYSPPNSVVRVLNTADGSLVQSIKVGYMPIDGLAISPDNKTLFAANDSMRQFSLADGKQIGAEVKALARGKVKWFWLSSDGKRAAISRQLSNDIQLWDFSGKQPKPSEAVLVEGVQQPMCFSPDLSLLACEVSVDPALLDFSKKGKRRGKR